MVVFIMCDVDDGEAVSWGAAMEENMEQREGKVRGEGG